MSCRWRKRHMLAPSSDLLRAGLGLEAQPGQAGDAVLSARPHQSGDRHGHLLCGRRRACSPPPDFPDRRLPGRHHRAVSLGRNQVRPVPAFGAVGALAAGDRGDPGRPRRDQAQAPAPQFPSLASRLRVGDRGQSVSRQASMRRHRTPPRSVLGSTRLRPTSPGRTTRPSAAAAADGMQFPCRPALRCRRLLLGWVAARTAPAGDAPTRPM